MTPDAQRALDPVPDPVPDPGQGQWWVGPVKVLRAVLRGLDRAATKVMKLLSYGAH